jgi:hypothetical protein
VEPGRVVRCEAHELLAELGEGSVGAMVLHPSCDIGVTHTHETWTTLEERREALTSVAEQAARTLKPGGVVLAMGDAQVADAWSLAAAKHGLLFVGEMLAIWDQWNKRAKLASMGMAIRRYVKPGNRLTVELRPSLPSNVIACEPVAPQHTWVGGQLPVGLLVHLVQLFTHQSDLVVDPMCGAGSSLVACELAGRRWIGGDKDIKAVETARGRVDDVEMEEIEKAHWWVGGREPLMEIRAT